jgi:hypothetical protein
MDNKELYIRCLEVAAKSGGTTAQLILAADALYERVLHHEAPAPEAKRPILGMGKKG